MTQVFLSKIKIMVLSLELRGPMGEISNFYNFLPRMLIFGRPIHMPPSVRMHAAKFH